MYTTKSLSEFKATPETASQQPPEGPNSGYVVIDEDAHEEIGTCCWGLCSYKYQTAVRDLPFPQNKILKFPYSTDSDGYVEYLGVLFVPVMNVPLAANRYYVVVAEGKHKGLVYTCSREEYMTTLCFLQSIQDVKPKLFDHRDIYQQIKIIPYNDGRFTAKSVASDGLVPSIFRQIWTIYEDNSKNYQLGEAFGINNAVRSNFLNLDLAMNIVAGMWYCPFIFVEEAGKLGDQMERSIYYQVILEQFWEKAHSGIEKKRILLRGNETIKEEMEKEGFVFFKKTGDLNGERIGLSLALWERIKWEENRNGWDEGVDSMKEEVKFDGFVLVERFSIKRRDGSVALALDFIHTDKVRTS